MIPALPRLYTRAILKTIFRDFVFVIVMHVCTAQTSVGLICFVESTCDRNKGEALR